MTLDIGDSQGKLVRHISSEDFPELPDSSANLPMYWVRPWHGLSADPGSHRYIWDLRWPLPPATRRGHPIGAIAHNTVLSPRDVWVLPGRYKVKLTVSGQAYSQTLTVRMDPRAKTTPVGLRQQFNLSQRIVVACRKDSLAVAGVRAMRARLDTLKRQAGRDCGPTPSPPWTPSWRRWLARAVAGSVVAVEVGRGPARPWRA